MYITKASDYTFIASFFDRKKETIKKNSPLIYESIVFILYTNLFLVKFGFSCSSFRNISFGVLFYFFFKHIINSISFWALMQYIMFKMNSYKKSIHVNKYSYNL